METEGDKTEDDLLLRLQLFHLTLSIRQSSGVFSVIILFPTTVKPVVSIAMPEYFKLPSTRSAIHITRRLVGNSTCASLERARRLSCQDTSSMYHPIATFFLLFLTSALAAISESPPTSLGKACSAASNHLDPRTKKFVSDCDAQTFCAGTVNGTCVPRQCRRDEFPFGYRANQTQPGLCPEGSFCPDEGDACRPLVAVGQPCQFNRDDQCAPSNIPGLADYHNFNGSVCLNSICT